MDFKRKLILGSLFLLAIFRANSAESDRKTSQQTYSLSAFASFDQFIDKSIGDEVPESVVRKTDAYRARQVDKTIWRLIDRKGYYFGLEKDFNSWCTSHSGTYQPLEGGANCLDQADNTEFLAGYRVVITTTAAYEGNMTAGYARIFFMRSDEMQIVDAKEKAQTKALSDQKANEKKCYDDWITNVRSDPKPGTNTNLGMIIESKLPLVQVQDLRASPPLRWVEVTQLRPTSSRGDCH